MHDTQLLEEYVTRNSETAFQSLVNRHLNLVYSTALRQTRNAALAEEVAQAVFILLARKARGLRKARNLVLSGWLYRTTCFVAARAVRGEARRQRRETEAFQMQQISSTDETWRRIAPLLDEGIEQLDPIDRNAILLRFFQDESLQAVGGALGISEEAARKRVSRSVEKLRAFFVRRGFTISGGMLATALAGQCAEAAPAGLDGIIGARTLAQAASGATLPVLVAETLRAWQWGIVKVVAGLGAAAIAVVVLAAKAWLSPSPPIVASPPKADPPMAVAVAQPITTTDTADKTWRLAFQAVDAETGQGIANAKVLVISMGDMKQALASPQQPDVQTNLQTDADGRCGIVLPYDPLLCWVGVEANGYAVTCVVGGKEKPLPGQYVLKVPRGATIGGVVLDESGRPVSGAGVQILFYGTGDSSDREFQRERPGFPSDNLILATTDSAGRWTFASAPTNGEFRITVVHPEFPTAGFQNDGDARTSPDAATIKLDDLHAGKAVLVLKAGLTLRGNVTDEYGYNVAGANVGLGRFFPVNHAISTESDGSFTMTALAPGENYITVSADGFAPQRIRMQINSNTAPLAVQLKPGAVLRLRVLDESGAPVPNARVILDNWQGSDTFDWGGLTDAGGRISWNSAPLEPISVAVLADGYFSSRNVGVAVDGQEHTITLHPPLIVVGRVTDAETKQPIPLFKAIPGSERDQTAEGSNGQYELTFTEDTSPHIVTIAAEGYAPATSERLDYRATHLTCNFELTRQAPQEAIQGVALLPDGRPAAGAQVAVSDGHGVQMGRARFLSSRDSVIINADVDGHFSFTSGTTARALAAVHQEGFAIASITGTNRSIVIQLQPWGRIEGTLRLTTQPNAGQQIVLSGLPAAGLEEAVDLNLNVYTTKTDGHGDFAFNQVPPGRFNLYLVILNEAYSHQTPVQIPPGGTVVAQIGGTGGILSGRLVLSGPSQSIDWSKRLLMPMLQTKLPYPPGISGLARAEWYEKYSQSEEGRARIRAVCSYPLDVQSNGAFTVEGIPPGDYELSGQLSDTTVDLSMGVLGHTIGSFRQDVTVPDPGGAQSGEKMDLGLVLVQREHP